MHEILNRNLFLVKERVGLLKAANNYDIYEPESGQVIMECREDKLGLLTKIFRFTNYKQMTPFDIRIRTPQGDPVVRVTRGVTLFRSNVAVRDECDQVIGGFKQKLLSVGGKFDVLDRYDRPLCTLKGKWTGWDFRFVKDDTEYAHVTKKWTGLGKELFTSADNYMLEIFESVGAGDPLRQLILAAVMCIDMVLKE